MEKLKEQKNLLSNEEINELRHEISEHWRNSRNAYWISKKECYNPKNISEKLCGKILKKIEANIIDDLNDESGFEFWVNINAKQGLHCDCDEVLRTQLGIMKYPVISSVYYHKIVSKKGRLVLYRKANHEIIDRIYTNKKVTCEQLGMSKVIIPEPNKLVIFGDRMPHYVEEWESGERISIAANLWQTKPLEEGTAFKYMMDLIANKKSNKI